MFPNQFLQRATPLEFAKSTSASTRALLAKFVFTFASKSKILIFRRVSSAMFCEKSQNVHTPAVLAIRPFLKMVGAIFSNRNWRQQPPCLPESTIINILKRKEYIGATVNFKTYTNSIWDKKQRKNPEKNRMIFYKPHPAIIIQEVFDKVQEIRQQRHRRTATGKLKDIRFAMMSKIYEDEQVQLKVEIVNLQKEVEVQERQIENLEQFIQRIHRYTYLTELTPYAFRSL
jgi:hypothetical protein